MMQTQVRRLAVVVASGLAMAAGQVALAVSFHPLTSPQYMQTVRETLAQGRPQTGERYTSNLALYGGDSDIGLLPLDTDAYAGPGAIGVASIQVSLLFSHTTIFWSILNDGIVIEPTPASQFGGFQVYPDIVDPTLPEDEGGYSPGERDAFTNNIRAQLNREAPFGFREQGGEAYWLPIIREAFRRWERVAGLRLVETADSGQNWDRSGWNVGVPAARNPSQGDIRIAMTAIDGTSRPDGTGGGIMAYTYPPLLSLLPVDRIDDNDTEDPDDDVLNVGYLGNIVLDEAELWNDPAVPNLFEIVMVREIGFALGMLPSCPNNPTEPFSVLQNQVFTTLTPGSPTEGQPFPQLFFTEPQFDDIRAVHDLYGDRLDSNNSPASPTFITYAPNPRDNIFRFAPHLAQPSTFFSQPALQLDGVARPIQLSIDAGDADVFRVVLPTTVTSADFRVRVEPYPPVDVEPPFTDGEFDPNDGVLGDCTPTTFNRTPIAYQDLSFAISAFDPFSNSFTPLVSINDTIAGEAEEVTIPVSAGTLYVTVLGDAIGGAPPFPQTQLYNLTIEVTTPQEETGLPFTRLQDTANVEAAKDLNYFGATARIGVIDGAHASDAHIVFSGRTIPRISWPGIGEAVTTAGAHATSTAALAAGGAFLDFEGVAPEAEVVSATVATEIFPDGTFAVGKNALYYALFALTSPTLARAEGLEGPATVVLSTWGAGGRLLTGEDSVAQAYDAAAWMNQVPIVVAAGNNGLADRGFTGCALGVPVDAESPGQQYLGSRSVISPATALNVISVGSTGEVDPDDINLPIVLRDAQDIDQAVPGYSSRGPIDSADLDIGGTTSLNVRSGIDIVAPGTGVVALSPDFTPQDGTAVLNPCNYVGATASSFVFVPTIESGDDPEAPANPEAFELSQGTSVSAAIVAGSIALLQDLAADQTPVLSTNPNVIKAVLLNGARKMRGWTNAGIGPGKPQDNRDGFNLNTNPLTTNVASTTNPLDFAQGAGVLDLERTIQNYLTGYPDVAPGEAVFEGPTIDPQITDVRVPTIRRPPAPGTGTISFVDAWLDEPGAGPAPEAAFEAEPNFAAGDADAGLTATEGAALEHDVTARDPDVLFGEPLQTRPFIDQKQGRGPQGVTLPFTPRVPFTPPSTNPPGGGPGTPGGPPPGPGGTSGVAPREIDAIVVDPMGWDLGNIDQRVIVTTVGGTGTPDGYIDYVINVPLLAARPDPANPGFELPADRITVTLCWQREMVLRELNFSNPESPRIGIVDIAEFENLNLQLFVADANGNATGAPVRQSVSVFSPTEHIFTNVPLSSLYLIRVRWAGPQSVYDLNNRRPLAEVPFAVAWRVDFSPRPASLAATDLGDVVSVLSSFGSKVGNGAYSMDVDRNYDGKVNFTDVTSVLTNFNPAARVR